MNYDDLKNFKDEIKTIEDCRLNGKFICENSTDLKTRRAYKLLNLNSTFMRGYYSILGYELVVNSGFAYLVEDDYIDTKVSKTFMDNFIDYIDIHKFLKSLDNSFISQNDYNFNISTLEERLSKDLELKATADKMSFIKKRSTYREFIESLLQRLRADGFIEPFDTKEGTFKLLKSYKYIEDIIEGVTQYE